MYVMLLPNKLLLSLLCIAIFTHPVYSGDLDLEDIESGKKSPVVEMSSINTEPNNSITKDIPATKDKEFHPQPIRILKLSEEVDEKKSNNATKADSQKDSSSIESVYFGNMNNIFATPGLQSYLEYSALFWKLIDPLISVCDFFGPVATMGLSTYATILPEDPQNRFIIYSIQSKMLSNEIKILSAFSKKIISIRDEQILACKKQNEHNIKDLLDSTTLLLINGEDANLNENFTSTPFLADYYAALAVLCNIGWDSAGVLSIICQSLYGVCMNLSQLATTDKQTQYILAATFFSFAGHSLYYSIKYLSKKTKEIEILAVNSRNYVLHQERKKKGMLTSRATSNENVANMV